MKNDKLFIKKRGITLLEIMIAMTIMAIALTSLFRYLALLQLTTQKSKIQLNSLVQKLSTYNIFKISLKGFSEKELVFSEGSIVPEKDDGLNTILIKNKEHKNEPIGIVFKYVYKDEKKTEKS